LEEGGDEKVTIFPPNPKLTPHPLDNHLGALMEEFWKPDNPKNWIFRSNEEEQRREGRRGDH